MFGFLKKLFGIKAEETKAECPYKVEQPVVEDLADIAVAQRPEPAPVVAETSAPAKKPRKPRTPKTGTKAPAKKTKK